MLCSKCSEQLKPIVAVDIDGTLGDYHEHFHAFAEAYVGRPLGRASTDCYNGDDEFSEYLQLDKALYRQIKLAYRQGGLKRSMPLFPQAKNLMWWLRQEGVEIWVTTTRPYLRLDGIDPDTREWLRRNDIPYDGLLYDEDKYQVLAERVDPARVVAIVDDLPEQCRAANAAFSRNIAVLVSTRYNAASAQDELMTSQMVDMTMCVGDALEGWMQNG